MSKANRSIDIIVYGSTGFTGQYICKYIQSLNLPSLSWAISGRSESKLESLLSQLETSKAPESKSKLPSVLVADASDEEALIKVFKQAKLVLNCTGPYR